MTSACAAPVTQMGTVSPQALRAEQLKQQQLVIRSELKDQDRLDDVGYPLLKAALPLCGPQGTATRSGVQLANIHTFRKEYQPAARALGFSDTLTVVGVAKGSAAERSGVAVGDRVLQIGGTAAPLGRDAVAEARRWFERMRATASGFAVTVRHGTLLLTGPTSAMTTSIASGSGNTSTGAEGQRAAEQDVSLTIPPDTVCAYGLVALKSDVLNAWADGRNVYVTSAMLRFAADDDELAVVLSHEIAHNAMRHLEAKKKNMTLGAIFGAIIDVAAATQGVNTEGEFTNQFAAAGSQVFSQDFEREADYVGLYILARAQRPFASAPDFWRRMAQEDPSSIKFASTHPTTAERFLRLEKTVVEIEQKRTAGVELMPEMKHKDKR